MDSMGTGILISVQLVDCIGRVLCIQNISCKAGNADKEEWTMEYVLF